MATEWTRDELIAMLGNKRLESIKLSLKDGDTTVQRVMLDRTPSIAKQYLGRLRGRQAQETAFLMIVGDLPGVRDHIARFVGLQNHSNEPRVFHTRWEGFDLHQWQTILGPAAAFLSVQGMLALIRGILKATERFHEYGMVHNDLHLQNIIVPFEYDGKTGRGKLLLDEPKLIDFEYSLRPPTAIAGIEGRGDVEWVDSEGNPLLLTPEFHSDHVCAAEVDNCIDPITKRRTREYRRDALGNVILKPAPFANLAKIDFGVDLFTLGKSLNFLIEQATPYWSDADIARLFIEHDYLLKLPDLLCSFDALPTDPRLTPHREIISEIDHLIGVHKHTRVSFLLPMSTSTAKRVAVPKTIDATTIRRNSWFQVGAKSFGKTWRDLTRRCSPPYKAITRVVSQAIATMWILTAHLLYWPKVVVAGLAFYCIWVYFVAQGALHWIDGWSDHWYDELVTGWVFGTMIFTVFSLHTWVNRRYLKLSLKAGMLSSWLLIVGLPLITGIALTISSYPQALRDGQYMPVDFLIEKKYRTVALNALTSVKKEAYVKDYVFLRLVKDGSIDGKSMHIDARSNRSGYLTLITTSPDPTQWKNIVIGLENQPIKSATEMRFQVTLLATPTHQALSKIGLVGVVTSVPMDWGPAIGRNNDSDTMAVTPKRILLPAFHKISEIVANYGCSLSADHLGNYSAKEADQRHHNNCMAAARDYAVSRVLTVDLDEQKDL